MKVADIGCGMTAFTIYLKENTGCDVTGVDPDGFEDGLRYKGHGVSEEFIKRTGIKFLRGDMTDVPLESDSQDRAYGAAACTTQRFGMFSDDPSKRMPADVFGMVLIKDEGVVETRYRHDGETTDVVPQYHVPTLVPPLHPWPRPLWRRIGGRLKRELGGTQHGGNRGS